MIKISAVEDTPKRQLNFGFMGETLDISDNFDRLNEDEISEMFYKMFIETLK